MKAAILVFPGSNCEQDLKKVLCEYYEAKVDLIWHRESFDDEYDAYFLPGGFSYGDYLRSGALAKMSLAIDSLKSVIQKGRLVLGICNGFQILTEAHFLPGALLRNQNLRHICKWVSLKNPDDSPWKWGLDSDFALPISHSEGNYICSAGELDIMLESGQVFLQYNRDNPNGSVYGIAGICNESKNVFGLMPHPERAFRKTQDIPLSRHEYGKRFLDQIFSHWI